MWSARQVGGGGARRGSGSWPATRHLRSNDVVEARKFAAQIRVSLTTNGILARPGRLLTSARAGIFPVQRVHDRKPFDDAADRRKPEAVERVEARRVVDEIEVELRRARVRTPARERHRAAFVRH